MHFDLRREGWLGCSSLQHEERGTGNNITNTDGAGGIAIHSVPHKHRAELEAMLVIGTELN